MPVQTRKGAASTKKSKTTTPLDKIEESESETSDSEVKNSDYMSGSSTGNRLRAKGSQIKTQKNMGNSSNDDSPKKGHPVIKPP